MPKSKFLSIRQQKIVEIILRNENVGLAFPNIHESLLEQGEDTSLVMTERFLSELEMGGVLALSGSGRSTVYTVTNYGLVLVGRMKRKLRYVARLDEVIITRQGDYAEINYKEEGIPQTSLKIGPERAGMSDDEVLELYNNFLRYQARLTAEHKYVAVEVPLNSPQISYSDRSHQWVSRGDVLRCLIQYDKGRLVVEIDDQELSLEEFGRMLTTHEGWGMRIEFVPEDEIHRRPAREVREPTAEND